MIARMMFAVVLLGTAAAAPAQSQKGESKLETAGKPIPKECIGLTGEKRQECIKKHGKPAR